MTWPYVIQQCVMTLLWCGVIYAIVLEVRDFRRWEAQHRAAMDSDESGKRAA
jgi:hypothetical protein